MNYEESLMVKAAYYYYFENTTQQEIAQNMGLTRIRIIKLLEKARKMGIIQFKLKENIHSNIKFEKELIKKFNLNDAYVVPPPISIEYTNANVANAAATYIYERLSDNKFINIGYGDTSKHLLNNLATMTESTISCVSLTGGVSYYLPDTRSNIFNAYLHLIPAPLIADSSEMVAAIHNETSVREIFKLVPMSAFTVIGIGAMHEQSTIFHTGTLTQNDMHVLKMKGAVGDILSHFIDKNGIPIKDDLDNRLIGLSLEKLKQLHNVIGVAGGLRKAEAIRAVLQGKYLDVLITDTTVAEELLRDS